MVVFSDSSNSDENTSQVVNNHLKTSIQTWNDVTNQNQKYFLFEKNPGLKIEIPHNVTIWMYLNLFITDEIINLMVVETNRNAEQVLSKYRLTKASRFS